MGSRLTKIGLRGRDRQTAAWPARDNSVGHQASEKSHSGRAGLGWPGQSCGTGNAGSRELSLHLVLQGPKKK